MIKLKVLIPFFSLFLSPVLWAQSFQFVSEQCAVMSEQNVRFRIGEDSFTSKLQVEMMFTESLPLPKIRLRFLQHDPAIVKIRWENILTQRRNVPFFSEEVLTQILQEEGQYFLTDKVEATESSSTFETQTPDLLRSQNMVALFLSQTQMNVSLINEFGDEWLGKVSLRASDVSYRQMVARCHPEQTTTYLKPSGERVGLQDQQRQAVSEGYGMVGFFQLNQLLPSSLRGESFSDLESKMGSTKTAELVSILQQKREILSKAQNDEALRAAPAQIEKIQTLNKERQQLSDELLLLSGNSVVGLTGLIIEKQKQEENLRQTLAQLTAQIEAQQGLRGPLVTETEQIEQALQPFVPQIEEFDKQVVIFNSKVEEIKIIQQRLMAFVEEASKILAHRILELESAGASAAPWSLEEIDKKIDENISNKNEYLVILALKESLVEIQTQAEVLIQKAQQQKLAAEKYLSTVAEQGARRRELSQMEAQIEAGSKIPSLASINTVTGTILNSNVEEILQNQNSSPRDYDVEFSFYESLYDQYQSKFSGLLQKAKSQGSLLMAQVICEPSVLLNPDQTRRSCLLFDELLNDSLRDAFVNNLAPKDLDLLLNNVPTPWSNDLSKTEIVARQLVKDIETSSELSSLDSAWLDLRHVIWRWSTMQKEAAALDVCEDAAAKNIFADGLYSSAYYETVFLCEQKQMEKLYQNKTQVTQQLISISLDVVVANDEYKKLDQEYSRASEEFVSRSMNKLSSAKSEAVLSAIFATCVLPLESAEQCAQAVEGELQKTSLFEQKTIEMVANIRGRANILAAETQNLMDQVKSTEDSKQQFMVTNSILPLMERKNQIQSQLAEIEKQVVSLEQTRKSQDQALTITGSERQALIEKEKKLVAQLTMVSLQIESLKFEQKDYCKSREIVRDQLLALDSQLFELFGKPNNGTDDIAQTDLLGPCF